MMWGSAERGGDLRPANCDDHTESSDYPEGGYRGLCPWENEVNAIHHRSGMCIITVCVCVCVCVCVYT